MEIGMKTELTKVWLARVIIGFGEEEADEEEGAVDGGWKVNTRTAFRKYSKIRHCRKFT